MDPAAEASRPWGDLPEEILVHIFAFLPCCADRVHMAAVNRPWRNALRPPPPVLPPFPQFPPELPWLIFPSTEAPKFYNPIADRYQVLGFNRDLPFDIRRARCCGSGDGGWLVVAPEVPPRTYALYNLNSGNTILLPPGEFDMHAAAIWPNNPAPPSMVAAIGRVGAQAQSTAFFWAQGDASWLSPEEDMPVVDELLDLVWHGNSFYFLTSREDVIQFRFEVDPNGNATLVVHQELNIRQRNRDVDLVLLGLGGNGRIKLHIVESLGGILMVQRYVYSSHVGPRTELIRVFQLEEPAENNGFQLFPEWVDVHVRGQPLEGRMLFLGSGCSRSLEVDHYPYAGFEESTIYFLDERMDSVTLADDRRQYLFTDMGRYSMGPMTGVPWPPGHPGTSDNAPPTWWFH